MRRIIVATLSAALVAAVLLSGGCSKPWTHPDYSGKELDRKFQEDSLKCEVVAGEEFPLDKHKQNKRFLMCMADLGWNYHPDGEGYRFQTKPR
ncbi:hypothetical protein DND132_2672 [Pseudodesulfovibrio mercurii]|uniref:Lipoprotein n=1 Tax=Pseudodesulfovibrio mercurii TaxID=641491 RepID=F0JIX6_9BACT|nr:hypothetical protein [Pseudodesulfovibrio mercurii]EGB15875.1 hypothetical protein DND132_2672 [Pseudodesulfovibrio mercurii]